MVESVKNGNQMQQPERYYSSRIFRLQHDSTVWQVYSQAGRRRFDPGRPLHLFPNIIKHLSQLSDCFGRLLDLDSDQIQTISTARCAA